MRVCGIKSHPSYRTDYSAYEVRLDTEIVRDCVFADDVDGRVICLVRDPVNNVIRSNDDGTGPLLDEKRGRVTIRKTSLPLTERYTDAFLALFQKNKTPIIRPH